MDESLIFNIRVRDVNDHAPQFPEKEFNISVKESHAAGALGVLHCVSMPLFALCGFPASCFDSDGDFDPGNSGRLFTAHIKGRRPRVAEGFALR